MNPSMRTMAIALATTAVAVLGGLSSPAVAAAQPVGVQALDQLVGSGRGTVFRAASTVGAPLLARFDYHFTNGDHHIRQVAAMPLPQQLAVQVSFADANSDDNFDYRLAHERVDPTGISQHSFHGNCRGECSVPLFTRPSGSFLFVLIGFRVAFDNGDHHLDKIGITESADFLVTTFRDQNGDDPFTYDVDYAWVPTSRLRSTLATGVVRDSGTVTLPANAGPKVIQGFVMDNTATGSAGDNHIRDLGVVAEAGSIRLHYGDNDPTDSADWSFQVRSAVVS
jgi:hypothetical protein